MPSASSGSPVPLSRQQSNLFCLCPSVEPKLWDFFAFAFFPSFLTLTLFWKQCHGNFFKLHLNNRKKSSIFLSTSCIPGAGPEALLAFSF